MKKLIEHIVTNYKKNNLNESLSRIVYHFTNLMSLSNIWKYNNMLASSGEYGFQYRKYENHICFTRQKHGSLGYSYQFNVRITLDGDKLNCNYAAQPVDYFRSDRDKKNKPIDKYHRHVESEDRLYLNAERIDNIRKYILRVDILFDCQFESAIDIIREILEDDPNHKVYVYENRQDFDLQTKKTINDKILTYNPEEMAIKQMLYNKQKGIPNLGSELKYYQKFGQLKLNNFKNIGKIIISKSEITDYFYILNKDKTLLSPTALTKIGSFKWSFKYGWCAKIWQYYKYNYINKNGDLLIGNDWFTGNWPTDKNI
jgi:hypothetical protein